MNSRLSHGFSIGFWIPDAASTADSGSGRQGIVHCVHAPLPKESPPSLPIRFEPPSIMILATNDPQSSVAHGISPGASETAQSDYGKEQSESMARGRDHRCQGFDLHEVQKGDRDQAVGNTLGVSGSGEAYSHPTAARQGELWMKYVIAPAVCQGQPEGLEWLAFQEFTNIFRLHRGSPNLWSPPRTGSLSLDRIRPPQRDVEVADGRNQHGQQREAVDPGAEEEGGEEIAVDEADNAVKGPERSQQRDQGDGPRRVPGAQRAEEGNAPGANEDHETQQLPAEFAVAQDDQVGTEKDADHEEEDRAQAVGDGRAAAGETDRGVEAEHGRKVAEQQVVDKEEDQVLAREPVRPPEKNRAEEWQCDHLLAVVEDAKELAEDEVARGKFGDQKQVERTGVALARQCRHALGIDQDQTEDGQADGDQAQHAAQGVFHAPGQVEEEPGAEGKQENVTSFDNQRLGSVGPGHELTPKDRVGPGPAVGPRRGGHAPVSPARDMQTRGRARRFIERSAAVSGCLQRAVMAMSGTGHRLAAASNRVHGRRRRRANGDRELGVLV